MSQLSEDSIKELAARVAAIQPDCGAIFARSGEYSRNPKRTAEAFLSAVINTKGKCQAAYLNNLNILLDAIQKSTEHNRILE